MNKLTLDTANQFELPPNLVAAIIMTESSGITTATRYEPGFFKRYVLKIPSLNSEERRLRSTSMGLMQVMGNTARALGMKSRPLTDLYIPAVGMYFGCMFLRQLKNRFYEKWGWQGVIAAYNAGSPRLKGGKFVNQDYVDKVYRYWREYDKLSA